MTSHGKTPRAVSTEDESKEWARVRSWTDRTYSELEKPPTSEGDREHKAAVRRSLAASEQLVRELQAVGIPLRRLGELSTVQLTYPNAAPVLLAHLERPYDDDVRAAILQALQRPYGGIVFEKLRDLLKRDAASMSQEMRGKYGDAIAANATKSNLDDVVAMIKDPQLGFARITIVLRAARWQDERVANAIRQLFHEHSLDWAALRAARLAKLWDLEEEVRPYLTHSAADFREEARAYIRALDKTMSTERSAP